MAASLIVVGGLLTFAYLRGGVPEEEAGAPSGGAEAAGPAKFSGSAGEFLGRSDGLDGGAFDGTDVGGLSALAYDPRRELYYALVDRQDGGPARYYALRLPLDGARLGEPEVFDVTVLRDEGGEPFGAGRLDGEGLAVTRWGDLLVASETGPKIFRFAPDGRLLGELSVPEKFLTSSPAGGEANNSFEGLALTPDGGTLFVAPQRALGSDRTQDGSAGRRIRLLRYEVRGTDDPRPDGEIFYRAGSDGGVADLVAVSGEELLVLEHGDEVFRVNASGARDVSGVESLRGRGSEPLRKVLVADLGSCAPRRGPDDGEPPAYEGLTLGPELPGGGRALLFLSDDNFDGQQTTGVAAIGLSPSPERDADPVCG